MRRHRPTRTLVVLPDAPDPDAIAEAAAIIRRGGLVAFATETVYGLGADATSPQALRGIFAAKGRPSTNPLIVHVDSVDSARPLAADWPDSAERLAARFWPGPLTLVLPKTPAIPDVATAGGPTVGLRVPRPRIARDLIARSGVPIAAPSANRSLGLSPTTARHVAKSLDGRIDLILDSGPTAVGLESTVLDLTGNRALILRPGTITAENLAEVLGDLPAIRSRSDEATVARSPGQGDVHYAPRTPAYLASFEDLAQFDRPSRAGLLVLGATGPAEMVAFGHRIELLSPEFAEPHFYDALHRLDEMAFDVLVIVPPPDTPQWAAVRDRLLRATRPPELRPW
ncbi:MAG TPA: L-threonylcarbamoyladenylate synthase [Isosphaeraceae bacterium]